jgi:hypothetical protein
MSLMLTQRPLRIACASVVLILAALALSGGCAQTRRYNVEVMNQTSEPITIGLAKDGGPFEPHLASPEEVAVGTPAADENLWPSEVVTPGRTGFTRVEGKFDGHSELLLRIYAGKLTLSEILSIGRGSTERVETVLRPEPAMNKLIVTRQDSQLHAEMVDRLPPPQTQPAGK